MLEPIRLLLDKLVTTGDWQPRVESLDESLYSERHVKQLMQTDPTQWGPITVTPSGDGPVVVDGHHRVEAARRLKQPDILAVVIPDADYGTAFALNHEYKLQLSNADRKLFARWLREQQPDLSYREIGRQAGLDKNTVKKAIEQGDADATTVAHRATVDPIGKLIRSIDRTDGATAKAIRRAIESYADDDRADVAHTIAAFGAACREAATPFLSRDTG